MTFLYPEFIYMMLLPAGLLIYLITTNKDVVERVFSAQTLDRLRISGDALGRTGHNTLIFAAFFFMTIALARPVIEQGEERVQSRGVDLVVALDLSRSMRASDFYPNRLAFAKQKLEEIVPTLHVGRIGMIGFTSASFIVAPLTTDRESLVFLLRRLRPETITAEGTDLSAAIEGAAKVLKKSDHRTLMIVTDGGEEQDMETLVGLAKRYGLRVIVWMVASEKGAPVPLDDVVSKIKPDEIVMSRANTALSKLAEATGGIYVPATLSQEDERRIGEFLEKLSKDATSYEKIVHHRIELFYYPLIVALLILPFALYSMGGGIGKRAALAAFMAILSTVPQQGYAGLLDFVTIEKGVEAYKKGEYKRASEAFEKVALASDKAEAWLDLGNSYYKSGRYRRACWAYGNVVTSDPYIEWEKLYNLANCHVRLGELEKAVELYRKALRIHEDSDVRYNLELVLKALEARERKKRQERKGGGEEKRQKSKGQGEGAPSKEKSTQPGSRENRMKNRQMSRSEEEKWMRLIQKQPMRAKLYPLTKPREGKRVDAW